MYNCEILADSLSPQGHRLTTFKVTYPRIVHAEMCRHRILSRNTASSRAIPFAKMVKDVEENPFIPIAWQKTHKGMQGSEYITDADDLYNISHEYKCGVKDAILVAKSLNELGVTKQLCNRLLEPFMWTTEIISGTEWENLFSLRCPQYEYNNELYRSKKDLINSYTFDEGFEEDLKYINSLTNIEWLAINTSQADIHIQTIAEMMWDAYNESSPKRLQPEEWHIPDLGHEWDLVQMSKLPIILNPEDTSVNLLKVRIATAHCAKISYDNFGTKVNYEADIKLHDRLLESKHFSPFEHCAKAMSDEEYYLDDRGVGLSDKLAGWCRNFRGFIQYRDLIDK